LPSIYPKPNVGIPFSQGFAFPCGLIGQDSDVLLQILPQVFPAAHAAGHGAIKTSGRLSSGGSLAWPGLVNIEKAIENGHRHYDIVNFPMKNDDFP